MKCDLTMAMILICNAKSYPNVNVLSRHIRENVCIIRSRINLSTFETLQKITLLKIVVL